MAEIAEFFNSYCDALCRCGDGYDSDEIATVVVAKTAAVIGRIDTQSFNADPDAVMALAVVRATAGGGGARVIDVGGAAGFHYLMVRHLLGNDNICWAVVETDAMVKEALRRIAVPGLSFARSIQEARSQLGGCDLLLTSGTIQYVQEPESLLAELLDVDAPLMLIARFPYHTGPRMVGIQTSALSANGPGPLPAGFEDKLVQYPVTFINIHAIDMFLFRFYKIIGLFNSLGGAYRVSQTVVPGISMLLRRKEQA